MDTAYATNAGSRLHTVGPANVDTAYATNADSRLRTVGPANVDTAYVTNAGSRQHTVGPANVDTAYASNARATLDNQSCVITSMLFEMNSTCMGWFDLNFSCLSTSITSAEVSSCQNKTRYPNPIWPIVITFRVFILSFCEFMAMVSIHVHKSTLKC